MDEDYEAADESDSSEAPEKAREEESETALLPKSLFGDKDLKPGSRCSIEVVAVYDDEVEVKYVKHEENGSKEDDMPDPFAKYEDE